MNLPFELITSAGDLIETLVGLLPVTFNAISVHSDLLALLLYLPQIPTAELSSWTALGPGLPRFFHSGEPFIQIGVLGLADDLGSLQIKVEEPQSRFYFAMGLFFKALLLGDAPLRSSRRNTNAQKQKAGDDPE